MSDSSGVNAIGREESPVEIEDGSEYEEDEVPLEPFFNYALMEEKDVKELTRTDTITCIAAHDKFLAIGTQTGNLYIMSHEGTMDHAHVPKTRPHRSAVTRLEVEPAGNYIITCAADGRVVISGLGSTDMNHVLSLQLMPRAVAISPTFSKLQGTPAFLMGERNLVFYEKKFFRYKDTTLYRGTEQDGFISRISWSGNYIAFTNDTGTRIYDRTMEDSFTLVAPSHDLDRIRSARFPPSHCWLSENSLVIGWADTVTVVDIVSMVEGVRVQKYGEIPYIWHLNGMFLAGISYIAATNGSWEKLVLFGLRPDSDDDNDFCDTSSMVSMQSMLDKDGPAPLVQVTVISPVSSHEFKLHSEDRLGIEVRTHAQPSQYSLVGLPLFNSYFMTGPKCLIVGTPYGALNAVKWRMEKGLWEEAFELSREKALELENTECDSVSVGRLMIEHYLETSRERLAAAKLKEVCGESRGEWEWAVQLFERKRLATLLADIIPTANPQLEPECYEIVLMAALWNDTRMFRKYVHAWSADLYRAGSLSVCTLNRLTDAALPNKPPEALVLSKDDELNLMRALAHLYLYERKFEQAIKIYVLIKDVCIFSVIDKYQLFDQVKDRISDLMSINTDHALRLLLNNEDSVSPQLVMSKIALQPKLQMAYLNRLFSKGEGGEFADRAVQLYADHDRGKLLGFFKRNEHYSMSKALETCIRKKFHEETILLLGKTGNHLDALDLMMKEYKRLDRAIDYCKEHEDPDLWSHLVDQVVQSPEHVVQLLNQAGSSIDPLCIIKNIPSSLEIPGLRNALGKILIDCASRVELLKGCRSATHADTEILLNDFLRVNRRTSSVGPRTMCTVCGRRFLAEGSKWSELTVFGCGHIAHSSCYSERVRRLRLPAGTCPSCSESQDELIS